MYGLVSDLFHVPRSLTGPGVRQTLDYLAQRLPELRRHSVPSGEQVFDWTVPDEWTLRRAYIQDEAGATILDTADNNLHVVGYSEPFDQFLDLEELDEILYSLPDQPDAVPYVTSYYRRRSGFCMKHSQRLSLRPGRYRAVVDADLKPGVLDYADLVLPGTLPQEVLLSTYICHPSMANNELSGPAVVTALVQWLMSAPRRYTYRIVLIPETIGSIVYLSRHLDHLKRYTIAGYVVTCVGDDRSYSYMPSRAANTLSDQAAKHALKHIEPNFKKFTWFDRGSDERQYCAPGVDLPIATICRSKYDDYPEYHTSLDDLSLVTPQGLYGGYMACKNAIEAIELDCKLQVTVLCEPQLGKRGLYPSASTRDTFSKVQKMMDLISLCDGAHTLLDIADTIDVPIAQLAVLAQPLLENGILRKLPE
jgi:aminopeptidase-like protein